MILRGITMNYTKKFTVAFFTTALFLSSPVQAKNVTWTGCGISKKAYVTELAKAFDKKYNIKVEVSGGGATKGIRNVATSKSDIGGSCRHLLNVDEEKGVTLHPVGWDALVAIVNKSNPVKNISLENLKSVFEGKITNWKELGGEDAPIVTVVRKGKISGVGRMVRELLFADPDKDFSDNAIVFKSSGPVEKSAEKEKNVIAMTGISSGRKRNVNFLSVDGHEPSYENIASGKYAFFRPLYLTAGKNTSAEGKKFIKFAKSKEGQAVIKAQETVTLKDGRNLWKPYKTKMKKARQEGNF